MIKAALLAGAKFLATKVTASKAAASAAAVVLATSEGGASLSTADVTSVLDLVRQVCGLFSMFPLNIFLIGGVASVGFKIFRQGKKAAK